MFVNVKCEGCDILLCLYILYRNTILYYVSCCTVQKLLIDIATSTVYNNYYDPRHTMM